MDSVVSSFVQIAPEAGIGWEESPVRAQKILTAAQMVAIPSLQTFGRYFIEGEALTPIVADALQKNFQIRACFLTLDKPSADDIIRYEGVDAWVRDISSDDQKRLVEEIALRSVWLKSQAQMYGFDSVDMTDGKYEDRANDAMALLTVGASNTVSI